MLWPEHVLVGYLYHCACSTSSYTKIDDGYNTMNIVIGSILPDVFMMILWMLGKDVMVIDIWTRCFYFLPHSLLVLPIVPRKWRTYYTLHILCDVISHTGEWSIRLLYPLTNFAIPGFYDPWKWI